MALDNLEDLNQPTKVERTLFQKIAGILELSLAALALIGIFFKIESWPYAAEMIIITFCSLSFVYAVLPIFVFRSKKIGGHILAHVAGFFLFITIMGALFRILSWEYAQEMIIAALFVYPPMLVVLLLLAAINFKDKERLKLYLRIGLRYLIVFMLLTF